MVPQGRLGAVRADPSGRRHGVGAAPHHRPAGCPPTGRPEPPSRQTTRPDDANNPPVRPPDPEPGGSSDPLAGAGTDRGWLDRPVVRAGLAVALLVLLIPGVKWTRNLLARRRAGHRPRDAVAESYARS